LLSVGLCELVLDVGMSGTEFLEVDLEVPVLLLVAF